MEAEGNLALRALVSLFLGNPSDSLRGWLLTMHNSMLKMNPSILKTLFWVTIFSIAMGYLESAVVVYLRALYYPEGFTFPLKIVAPRIAVTEIFREFATMLMLIGIGVIAGRTKTEKFACFIYSFAVWDVFYYVFLKIILNWPDSLFTWDLLFMIPILWVGPVIAPVINSLTMLVLALLIFFKTSGNIKTHINKYEWSMLILGSLIVIVAYSMDYAAFITARFSLPEIFSLEKYSAVLEYASTYIPKSFNWPVFSAGAIMHAAAIAMFCFRKSNQVATEPILV